MLTKYTYKRLLLSKLKLIFTLIDEQQALEIFLRQNTNMMNIIR